jgi:hypothetical protein
MSRCASQALFKTRVGTDAQGSGMKRMLVVFAALALLPPERTRLLSPNPFFQGRLPDTGSH